MKLTNKYLSRKSVFVLASIFFLLTASLAGTFIKNKVENASAASTTFDSGSLVEYASGIPASPIHDANGNPAYCFDIDKDFPTGHSYTDNGGEITDANIKGIIYYGFGGIDNSLRAQFAVTDKEAQYATQVAVWKRAREVGLGENTMIDTSKPVFTNPTLGAYYDALKAKTYTSSDFKVTRWTSSQSDLQSILNYERPTTPQSNEFKFKIVKKDDGDNSLSGVKFQVSLRSDFSKDIVEVTTNSRGEASGKFQKASNSETIYVREVDAPSHVAMDSTVKNQVINAGQTGNFEFINNRKKATVNIEKTDETGANVAGVVFETSTTRDFSTNVKTLPATNAQGKTSIDYVLTSDASTTYYIREKSVPVNMIKSDEVKSVVLGPNNLSATVSFVNRLKKTAVRVIKTDSNNLTVSGVQFKITYVGGTQTATTDQNGIAIFANIPYEVQSLELVEVSAPSWLNFSTAVQTINLKQGEINNVSVKNVNKVVDVVINKTDSLGQKVEGVVFEVAENANFTNPQEVRTNTQGQATRNVMLTSASKTVYIREKSVPAHLTKSNEVKTLTLTPDQLSYSLSFVNTNKSGVATIRKIDETGANVAGVVFETSTTRDFSANVKTLLATNAQGITTVAHTLTDGNNYTLFVREKSVPAHLIKSTEIKQVVFSPTSLSPAVTFINKLKGYPVELSKTDLSSADPIEGVTLTIYKADDKQNNTKIYESVTDKTGKLKDLKLVRGKYKFIETHATIGYKINPEPHFFEVMDDGEIVGSTTMTNEREEYEFEIDKVDSKGNKVAGVVFSAKNKLTGDVLTATTDESGVAKFKGIWADYEIKEESAPAHLIKDNQVYFLSVKNDGSYEKMKVVNKIVETPNTGVANNNSGWIAVAIAGFAVLLGGVTFAFIKRK